MDTKLKGDIAEQAAILHALNKGFAVLRPIGDRLPYDLVLDLNRCLIKVQVKCAWFNQATQNYVVDNRRTQTNRRIMKKSRYDKQDFQFALVYLPDKDLFYVFPSDVFVSYAGQIHMVEADKRQRKPRSVDYRDAWNLILQWAARDANCA